MRPHINACLSAMSTPASQGPPPPPNHHVPNLWPWLHTKDSCWRPQAPLQGLPRARRSDVALPMRPGRAWGDPRKNRCGFREKRCGLIFGDRQTSTKAWRMRIDIHGNGFRITQRQSEVFTRVVHRSLARFGPHIESATLLFERLDRARVRCRLEFSGPRCGIHVVSVERTHVDGALAAALASVGVTAGRALKEGVENAVRNRPRVFRGGLTGNPNRLRTASAPSSEHERRKAG